VENLQRSKLSFHLIEMLLAKDLEASPVISQDAVRRKWGQT
jgi:hypothetical protein